MTGTAPFSPTLTFDRVDNYLVLARLSISETTKLPAKAERAALIRSGFSILKADDAR
jgi:hypothetical protein